MIDDLSKYLRDELAEMAATASVDMELWNRFSNRVLAAADALEAKDKRIAELEKLHTDAMGAWSLSIQSNMKRAARIAALEAENEILQKNTAIQMGQLLCENPDALSGNPAKWRFTIFDIQQLEARIAELENLLKPFAQLKDRKSTRLNSSHIPLSRMPSSA